MGNGDLMKAGPESTGRKAQMPDDTRRPVWLEATESFYRKLNRIAQQCEMSRYDALSKGLDALLREAQIQNGFEPEHQEPCAVGGVPQDDGAGLAELLGNSQS